MSTPIISQPTAHSRFFPPASQAMYRAIASKWRKAHSQPDGVVYIWDEIVQGWSSVLRPADQWRVGVVVITQANEVLLADGVLVYPRGAERWLLISESVPKQPQAEALMRLSIAKRNYEFARENESPEVEKTCLDALRYHWLRSRDIDTIQHGGVFAGLTPSNVVLNGEDLDKAIDDAMRAGGVA